ncbi:hypothetical protein ADL27_42005, partial [Streptomyces sp. NRRL F-6602]
MSLSQARECWSEVVERLQHGEEIVLENTRNRQAAVMRRLEDGAVLGGAAGPAAPPPRHTPPRHERPRPQNTAGLTGLGDVLDGLLADEPETMGLSTGVAALDGVCGGLARGSVTLVAAPPNAGGSLLPLQAARAAAFDPEQPVPVLYALSGVPLQVAA